MSKKKTLDKNSARAAYVARHIPNEMHLSACMEGSRITRDRSKYNRKDQKRRDRRYGYDY